MQISEQSPIDHQKEGCLPLFLRSPKTELRANVVLSYPSIYNLLIGGTPAYAAETVWPFSSGLLRQRASSSAILLSQPQYTGAFLHYTQECWLSLLCVWCSIV